MTMGGHISVLIGYYKGACETPATGSSKNRKILTQTISMGDGGSK